MTKTYTIDKNNIDIDKIKQCADILKNNGTVIFPTETVYGLGANALDESATKKIYISKGRPSDNPLIVHIADKSDLEKLVVSINENAKKVIDKFWPGPITIILQKKDIVPSTTSGGLDTVAVRMPSHPIALSLIKEAKVPIAAPSANISGRPSPTCADDVFCEMNGRVDAIILGGDCNVGLESTVIDLTSDIPMILRPGGITLEQLKEVVADVIVDPAISKNTENLIAKAPGMKYTHYSPNAKVFIVNGQDKKVYEKVNELTKENEKNNIKSCVICMDKNKDKYECISFGLGKDLSEVAHNLFKVLIEVDKHKIDIVYCESFEQTGIGHAIMNRLLKSAGHKVIYV